MASTDGAQSLRTASSYINNLLLSRGLLRNGQPIGFASPAEAEGGLDATMAKVMNLVHDLILRRDVSSLVTQCLSGDTVDTVVARTKYPFLALRKHDIPTHKR